MKESFAKGYAGRRRVAVLLLAGIGGVGAAHAGHSGADGHAEHAAQAAPHRFYVEVRAGVARSSVGTAGLERDFARQGVDADVSSVDGSRAAYALTLGMALSERLAVEVGYMDLGDVELRFSTTTTAVDLARVHPESGAGFTAGLRYSHPLTASLSAQARAGLFAWQGDYDTHRGAAQVDDNKESERDFYWGAGLLYALNRCVGLSLDYQRIAFERYPANVFTLGAQWRFDL